VLGLLQSLVNIKFGYNLAEFSSNLHRCDFAPSYGDEYNIVKELVICSVIIIQRGSESTHALTEMREENV